MERLRGTVPCRSAVEIDRPALLARLAQRWQVPVTLVVAGAGFGKSTVLAQAYRADELRAPGLQCWMRIEPALEDADAFTSAVFAALGAVRRSDDPLGDLLRLFGPAPRAALCLVIDDVHRLGARSSAAALLGGLVRRLPDHVHLVLSGRTAPPVPLAALRAADRVLEIGEPDLAFTARECTALAGLLGRSADVAHVGGWPALVRLRLARGDRAGWQFPREEVLAGLSDQQVVVLFVLATIGPADVALVSEIVGFACDLDDLAENVPLVARVGGGAYHAHELWTGVIAATRSHPLHGLRRRAVQALVARGDLERAGTVAVAGDEWALLAEVSEQLVVATLPVHRYGVGRRWLSQAPPAERARTGLVLLAAADRLHGDDLDESVDALLDRCVPRLAAASRWAALALGTIAATARHDLRRLDHLVLPVADDDSAALAVRTCARATRLELAGDPEAALDLLATVDEPALRAAGTTGVLRVVSRVRVRCLLLAGRPADAAAVARSAASDLDDEHLSRTPAMARWLAGDAGAFGRPSQVEEYAGAGAGRTSGDPVLGAATPALAASWGQISSPVRREDATRSLPVAAPRDAALLSNARAAVAVAAHQEAEAAACFDALLALHPPQPGAAERHLRRNLALGYVLEPRLRALWDSVVLAPQEQASRRVARLLLAGREGRWEQAADVDPELVFTAFPLPWSVELAARLQQRGHAAGMRLAAWLIDRVGAPVRAELRRLATDEDTAAGAAALLAELPVPPEHPVTVGVLGPLVVRHGDVAADDTDLRRCRVRELLQILVLERTATRDRLVDLLWPDLDPSAGARNLRVTLTYLRRLLEPARAASEACYVLRSDLRRIWLHPGPALVVDLWQLRSRLARARAAREAGDPGAVGIQLAAARGLWRGRALADLERITELDAAVIEVGMLRVSVLLQLGDLCLRTGRAGDAGRLAAEALALDEFAESAHRLAMAAALVRGDGAEADRAARRAVAACRELGTAPESATRVLLRRSLREQHTVPRPGRAA